MVNLDVSEVVILLMIYLIENVLRTKQKMNVFDITTGINDLKILTKHVSRKCECKFDGKKCNLKVE